jgi:hypothetical protein
MSSASTLLTSHNNNNNNNNNNNKDYEKNDMSFNNEDTNDEDDDYNYDDDDNDYDDCNNFDDDHNNNNIYDSGDDPNDHEEETEEEKSKKDPEYFDYDSYPIDKIDWIMEQKYESVASLLKLSDPVEILSLLSEFKWNNRTIIELMKKDRKHFIEKYLSNQEDDNNNNKNTTTKNRDISSNERTRLLSYLNIFNGDNCEKKTPLFSKILKELDNKSTTNNINKKSTLDNFCSICCSSSDANLLSLDECTHEFCIDCWSMHFESLINQKMNSLFECMEHKCSILASKDFVVKCIQESSTTNVLRKKHLIEQYRKRLCIDLVHESDDMQLCPGEESISVPSSSISSNLHQTSHSVSSTPLSSTNHTPSSSVPKSTFKLITTLAKSTGSPVTTITTVNTSSSAASSYYQQNMELIKRKCSFIVWIKSRSCSRRVFCSQCQHQYCFLCALPYHAPNSCATIRKWNSKCQDDSETRNYLLANTQDCPKCKVCIEKNGGCSHMTCNRCKHEFCWGNFIYFF